MSFRFMRSFNRVCGRTSRDSCLYGEGDKYVICDTLKDGYSKPKEKPKRNQRETKEN